MRLNIFARLLFSYFAIIIFFGMINAYSVWVLHRLNTEVSIIFQYDRKVLDLKDQMGSSIESQAASAREFFITRNPVLLKRIDEGQKEFDRYLARMSSAVYAPEKREILVRLISNYDDYKLAINKEIERLRTAKAPGIPKKVDLIARDVSDDLKVLQEHYETDIDDRTNRLLHTAAMAQKISIVLFCAAVIFMILGLIINTRGITRPLNILKEKTREISRGVFEGDLEITSPREVSELAGELNRMCESLKEVDIMKSGFFASMSHELRTPLASIKQGISLLRDRAAGPVPDKQKRLFIILTEETNRLIELVNSILELSKMEAGMMPFALKYDDLPTLVRKVVNEMTPLVEAKKVGIRIDSGDEEEVPPVRLDRERILQALRNLVGNAVKFTPENGEISIEVCCRNGCLECSIHDTGPGIPAESLDRIFEKFHQSPVRTSGPIKGTGLGLAFVKHIIAAHGGSVWAESEPGKGATFVFALPLDRQEVKVCR